jgi:PAS domain-containing protein
MFPNSITSAAELAARPRTGRLYYLQIKRLDICTDRELNRSSTLANRSGRAMRGRTNQKPGGPQRAARNGQRGTAFTRPFLTIAVLVLAVCSIAARMAMGSRMDGLLVLVLAMAATEFALRLRFAEESANFPDADFAAVQPSTRWNSVAYGDDRMQGNAAPEETTSKSVSELRMPSDKNRVLENYFECATDGICALDAEERISFANPAAEADRCMSFCTGQHRQNSTARRIAHCNGFSSIAWLRRGKLASFAVTPVRFRLNMFSLPS